MKKCAQFSITQVWERLFIGSMEDAEQLAVSNPHRITTVLSLCAEKVVKRARKLNYLHIAIADAKPISVGQFDAVIDAIAENIRWGTVLLHSEAGTSPAPLLAAAWMHVVGYKNVDAALKEIAELRPIITPSTILLSSVREYL